MPINLTFDVASDTTGSFQDTGLWTENQVDNGVEIQIAELNTKAGAVWFKAVRRLAKQINEVFNGQRTITGLSVTTLNIDGNFDNRSTPTTTPSAGGAGGAADFSFDVGAGAPLAVYFQVTASGATTNSDIRLYRNSTRTDVIYEALSKDLTSGSFVDATPFALFNAQDLEANTVYGRITNNGSSASTYTVRLVTRR